MCVGKEKTLMTDREIRIIENFITKDKPIMEFEEMRAVVEMAYEIYKNMNPDELPKWIYRPVNDPLWDNLFEQIEEALGFKLFFWQKTYIMGLGYRCSGQTTADVLRNLVGDSILETIYLEHPKNQKEDFYQKELIEIKRKLDAKGIISRNVKRRK